MGMVYLNQGKFFACLDVLNLFLKIEIIRIWKKLRVSIDKSKYVLYLLNVCIKSEIFGETS